MRKKATLAVIATSAFLIPTGAAAAGGEDIPIADLILLGTRGDDHLVGGPQRDTIHALDGDDFLAGRGGADTLRAGPGSDDARGGDGADVLKGRLGTDELRGSDGKDAIYGGLGRDVAYGADGADRIYGGGGPDTLNGGSGKDNVVDGDGRDLVRSGDGNDSISIGRPDRVADQINCGPGMDSVQYVGGVDRADSYVDCEIVLVWINPGKSLTYTIHGETTGKAIELRADRH